MPGKKKQDFEVGYGKPPKHSQFKKGQSGNKKGRPKGARNFKTDVIEVLTMPVPVTENGRKRTISTQRATLLRLREKGLNGEIKAIDRLMALAGVHNAEDLASDAQEQLSDTDQEIIDHFLARHNADASRREPEADDE